MKIVAAAALVVATAACGSPGTHAQSSAESNSVSAKLSEWKIQLSRTTFSPGSYSFAIRNVGTVQHELIAFRVSSATAQLPMDAKADVNEEAKSIVKATDGDNIGSGGTQTRSIDLSTPGAYVFLCNLPGHYKLGMHTIVTVTAK